MPHSYRDIPAAGSTLSIKIATVMTVIPGVSELSWEGMKRGIRNPTPLSALTVVKKPGMPDLGQIKCKVFFDPNDVTHIAIRDKLLMSAAAASAALDDFELKYADGFTTPAHAAITGFVSDFSHASGDAETGTWDADLTVEVVTAVYTPGAPAET